MTRQNPVLTHPRRAALYIRVSTEEQAKKGYSLDAQREDLEQYANRNNYTIVDLYIDEGKSARKRYTQRREFMRMMEDIRAGMIDIILFIKLDRWFRNVADYYKIQEILDTHSVAWKTTQEHYDTETTNGRLYINIRLAVAQDESDRDSDRIKFVFDSKVARGEVISGSLPMGLMIQNKRVVPDPQNAQAVRDVFSHYQKHHSLHGAVQMLEERYGIVTYEYTLRKILRNPLYAGRYRSNPNYCPPLVSPQDFDAVQSALSQRSIRTNESKRVYLFSGLLLCRECGQHMAGNHTCSCGRDYNLYRCRNAVVHHRCDHRKSVNEAALERWLLTRIDSALLHKNPRWSVSSPFPSNKMKDLTAAGRKLEKLKRLYLNDLIPFEEYVAEKEAYATLLSAQPSAQTPRSDQEKLNHLLESSFSARYQALTPTNRRSFWNTVIQSIILDAQNTPHVTFRAR